LYFITFRTAAAVSLETLASLKLSRYTPDQIRKEVELALDFCQKGDLLRGAAAEIVANATVTGHGRDYLLDTWCIMPNHVHLLIRIPPNRRLAEAVQPLKSCTAHRINKLLGLRGKVWEREYFDRLVRPGQTQLVRSYILNNPRKANLINWHWFGSIVAGEAPALL